MSLGFAYRFNDDVTMTLFRLCFLSLLLVVVDTVAIAAEQSTVEKNITEIRAQPMSFCEDTKLRLMFPKSHPQSLAIRNPDGIWYTLHSDSDKIWIVPDAQFKQTTHLQLDTESLVGITWKAGKQINEKVFMKPGKYLIYMADNLETEPDNTFHFMTSVSLKK